MSRAASTHEYWRRIIGRQKRSGLSVARFCREQHLAQSSFFAWKRRLQREAPATPAPAFVPILCSVDEPIMPAPDAASPAAAAAIELCLEGGRRLLLRPGFDPATLQAALAVLEKNLSAAQERP